MKLVTSHDVLHYCRIWHACCAAYTVRVVSDQYKHRILALK